MYKTVKIELDYDQLHFIKDSLELHFDCLKSISSEKLFDILYQIYDSTYELIHNALISIIGGSYEKKND